MTLSMRFQKDQPQPPRNRQKVSILVDPSLVSFLQYYYTYGRWMEYFLHNKKSLGGNAQGY